jgi:hypothetical protein
MSSGRRRGHHGMTFETWRARTIIAAQAEVVFAVLAHPVSHAAVTRDDPAARCGVVMSPRAPGEERKESR